MPTIICTPGEDAQQKLLVDRLQMPIQRDIRKHLIRIATLVAVTSILIQCRDTSAQSSQQPDPSTTILSDSSNNDDISTTNQNKSTNKNTETLASSDRTHITQQTASQSENITSSQLGNLTTNPNEIDDGASTGKDPLYTTVAPDKTSNDYVKENLTTAEPFAIDNVSSQSDLLDAKEVAVASGTMAAESTTDFSATYVSGALETTAKSIITLSNTETQTEIEKNYVRIAFITNNPKERTTSKYEHIGRTTKQDGALSDTWTTEKRDLSHQYSTETTQPTVDDSTKSTTPQIKVNFTQNNVPLIGHLVTLPSINVTNEHKNESINKKDCNHSDEKYKNKTEVLVNDSIPELAIPQFYANFDSLTNVNKDNYSESDLNRDTPILPNLNSTEVSSNIDLVTDAESLVTSGDFYNSSLNNSLTDNKMLSEEDRDILEASNYGLKMMDDLYGVQEPKLYKMGLWLEPDNPARFVATFNWQSEEARKLAKYGYASLQASAHLKKKYPEEIESRVSDREGGHPRRSSLVKSSALREQCPLRGDPRCPPASKRYRTHDGTCNNPRRPRWGSALSPAQRFLPPSYSDGLQAPRLSVRGRATLPSARRVSSAVHADTSSLGGRRRPTAPVTHMLMQWGQFLDHDVTSSSQSRGFNGSVPRCCGSGGRGFIPEEFLHPECMPILVPNEDPFYGPLGIKCLEFLRSGPAPRENCELGWREQLNRVTAFVDASPIYGASARQSDKLRIFRNGLLQYGRAQARRPLLPAEDSDEEALCRGGAVDVSCFKAGDGRVNEHPGLVAIHIVWLRKHNRYATELSHLNPHWSDEKVYQETRKIIGALVQHITYKEFLPIILGSEVVRLFQLDLLKKGYYKGYSSKVNPNPANSFGAAAFRFGHSLVQDSFVRYDRFHRPLPNNVSLHDELTNPSNIWSFGAVDRLILGMSNQLSQKRDEFMSPELTNHLFQTSRFAFGMDLASINIQRGRDHGLPSYTTWREPCGLSIINDWDDLVKIMPSRAVRKMEEIYRDVDDIDLFTGGMAERPVIGGLVGPTFACIIAQQFSNLRRGDRFWYENGEFESSFTPAQLQQLRRVTLAQVLCKTMENVDTIQPFVFLSADDFRNGRVSCDSNLLNNFDLTPWTERSADSENDINSFDRIGNPFRPTVRPHFSQAFDSIPSSSFTQSTITKKQTTTDKQTTTSIQTPVKLDDKLDLPNKKMTTPTPPSTTMTVKTKTTRRPTIKTKLTTEHTVKIDDKLDFSAKTAIDSVIEHKIDDTTNNTLNDRRSFTDDSLSLLGPESREGGSNDTTAEQPTDDADIESAKLSSSVKTYGILLSDDSPLPFFSNLYSSRKTTTTKPQNKPRPKPHITYYQQSEQTTAAPNRFTYLINIVPKTTPKYQNDDYKETIKITVQGDRPSSNSNPFPYNKRPVYNNNRLEYRPVNEYGQNIFERYGNTGSSNNYYRPQKKPTQSDSQTDNDSRPYGNQQSHAVSQDSYDSHETNSYNQNTHQQSDYRPSNNRPHRPLYNDDYTTEYNPYSLVTFSHIETTKKYDLFNRPQYDSNGNIVYQTTNTYYRPTRPPYISSDDSYVINPRPIRPVNFKPVSTGITIYIDNKPSPVKPQSDDANSNVGYGTNFPNSATFDNTHANEDETVPLFTRPSYQRPLLQKPVADFRPQYPKPNPFDYNRPNDDTRPNNSEQDDNGYKKPLQSEHGHFSADRPWSQKPNGNNYPQDNYNDNSNNYGSKRTTTPKYPSYNRPTNVNVNLASQYGNQHHTDISIVIEPNVKYKSNLKSTVNPLINSHPADGKPLKFYYIGNVLHKYKEPDNSDDGFYAKNENFASELKQDQIIKENYNNAWKPDKNEHKLFYGPADDDGDSDSYEGIKGSLKSGDDDIVLSLTNATQLEDLETKSAGNNDDLEGAFSDKQEAAIDSPPLSFSQNKVKSDVLFKVLPSDNSPTLWMTYKEKPEENLPHYAWNTMPSIDSDPHASKELPRPMNFSDMAKGHKTASLKRKGLA